MLPLRNLKAAFRTQNRLARKCYILIKSLSSGPLEDPPKPPIPPPGKPPDKQPEVLTMEQVKIKILKRLGLDIGYVIKPKPRDHLLKYEPKPADLPPRTMNDSFTSAIIPLSKSVELRDKYMNAVARLRLGRLMEDMDLFAVWVCHQHLHIPKLEANIPLPYTFVTVLVDKINFTEYKPSGEADVVLSGHVSWASKSTMEIVVWLKQSEGKVLKRITRALFLMAARNANNTKAAPVNPLKPGSPREKRVLSSAIIRCERRKLFKTPTLRNLEPNAAEHKIMYELFRRTTKNDTMELNARVLPKDARWLSSTRVVSTVAVYPESRNAHNTVFGGFLMRNALEMSWVCAALFCGMRPKLLTICDIRFQKKVRMPSIIKVTAHVVFTLENYVQILTIIDILDARTGDQVTTNNFSYTFRDENKVAEVLPRSYDETLWYIEGRRKFLYGQEIDRMKR